MHHEQLIALLNELFDFSVEFSGDTHLVSFSVIATWEM